MQLHALDQRLFRTAYGHVGPMQGYFNEIPYNGLVFGHFNETSSQVGKISYAMAVHAVHGHEAHTDMIHGSRHMINPIILF